ncbi:MAG TPA: hypothetical protein PLQ67_03170, partial [Burkholderiaceae bacterium]|nr:hypothetical protein [Burkholderiaceae bacterium]
MTQITTSSGQVITAEQALQYADSVDRDYRKVALAAKKLGLDNEAGKKFLAQTFKTDAATVDKVFKEATVIASNSGAEVAQRVAGGGQAVNKAGGRAADQAAPSIHGAPIARQPGSSRIELTPTQAGIVRGVIFGAGNQGVSNQDIQSYAALERSPEALLSDMVRAGLSAQQAGRALGLSAADVSTWLETHGVDERSLEAREVANRVQISPQEAGAVFAAVYGAGNRSVPDELIQDWFKAHPHPSPRQVIETMVAHNLSAAQVGRALDLSAQRVQELLFEYGVDQQSLINKEVEGWTQADFDRVAAALPDGEGDVIDGQGQLAKAYGRVEPLLADARAAQDRAALFEGKFNELNAVFEPAFDEYNALAQELAGLQAYVQSEHAQRAQGEDQLAGLDAVTERRMRRETAQREANYQVDNAAQGIAQAQARIEQIQARMQALEAWGKPLMEKTEAARAQWQQAAELAQQKSEIANTQAGLALTAADAYRASVTALSADHSRLVAYLVAHPSMPGASQAQASIKASIGILDRGLQAQRQWGEQARQLGLELDEHARALEDEALGLQDALDPLQPERIDAQMRIAALKEEYAQAVSAEQKAQAALDGAYAARVDADYQKGKGGRNRARDEANRLIELRTEELARASLERERVRSALDEAKEAGQPNILEALEAQGAWERSAAQAANARSQASGQAQVGAHLMDLESNTQSALAVSHLNLIKLGQVKVDAAESLVESGQMGVEALTALSRELQDDLNFSVNALQGHEQFAVNDRYVLGQEREALVGLQAQALGGQLIADNLIVDASNAQEIVQTLDLVGTKEAYIAARQRLDDATWALESADMHMDWAQGKVNAKKQAKALKRATPELKAAKEEFAEAQLAFDMAEAKYLSAQRMAAPLQRLAQETGYEALSALQRAQGQGMRADTQSVWTEIAQARYDASDTALAAVETGLMDGSRALSRVQALIAQSLDDPQAAQLMQDHSEHTSQWADDYSAAVVAVRQAQMRSDAEQATFDVLRVQTEGVQVLQGFLEGKVDKTAKAFDEAKARLGQLEDAFSAAAQVALARRSSAEEAFGILDTTEKAAQIDYIATHRKPVTAEDMRDRAVDFLLGNQTTQPSEEQIMAVAKKMADEANQKFLDDAHANASEFIKNWEAKEFKTRKTDRKKLQWLDDKLNWVAADPKVQDARLGASASITAAQDASQAALVAGQDVEAQNIAASLRARIGLEAQVALTGASLEAEKFAHAAAKQAQVLATALADEAQAGNERAQALVAHVGQNETIALQLASAAQERAGTETGDVLFEQAHQLASANQGYTALASNADVIATLAKARADDAVQVSTQWGQTAQAAGVKAKEEAAALEALTPLAQAAIDGLKARFDQSDETLTKVAETHMLSAMALRMLQDRADYALEIGEQRDRADYVHKQRK